MRYVIILLFDLLRYYNVCKVSQVFAHLFHLINFIFTPLSSFYPSRGTASKRQMEDNLNFSQKSVDFHALSTATLDCMDGLELKKGECSLFGA